MKKYQKSLHLACAITALTGLSASAQVIAFGSATEYADNFVGVSNNANTVWATDGGGGGYLSSQASSATVIVFNENDNGAAGANQAAGTFDAPRQTFGSTSGFTLTADFQAGGSGNGKSFGFYTKVNDAATVGYSVLFRLDTGSIGDIRFFDSNGNPSTGAVGSSLGTTGISELSLNTWYTVQLNVVDTASSVIFNASIWQTGVGDINNPLATATATDTTSPVLGAGQYGARISSDNALMLADNIGVVPEPSTFALLGGMIALGCVLLRRRLRADG